MPSQRLVVGIDYGTSNSGAAYALIAKSARHDDEIKVNVIDDWPEGGYPQHGRAKIPSDIAYDRDGRPTAHGYLGSEQYTHALQWVKLLLEPECLGTERKESTARVWDSYDILGSKGLPKTPVDVVADYLTWFWENIKSVVQEAEGDDDLFDQADLTVVLTVPAQWSQAAKRRMEKAAKIAGIPETSLRLIAEPEAAAIFGLKEQAKKGLLNEGDCVIVCDAGGGTVDVVSYQVRSVEPLTLDQVTVCQGDFCGSVFINAEFRNQVVQILGDDLNRLDADEKRRLEDEFEQVIKPAYDPHKQKTYTIPVPHVDDDAGRGIRNGRMTVDDGMLSESFGSVMTQLMNLLDSQIELISKKELRDRLKGILLVGGFSGSRYLKARVKEYYSGKGDPKIWSGSDPLTAVVRGAVACETAGRNRGSVVYTRLSRHNYGILYHEGNQKKVRWLIRKSQPVRSDMPTEPYALRIDEAPWLDRDEYCHLMVPLVKSEEDDASDNYGSQVSRHAVIDCRIPTKVRFSSDAILVQDFPTKAWHIPATLVLWLDGAIISFRCQVQGTDVGSARFLYSQESEEAQDAPPDPANTFRDSVLSDYFSFDPPIPTIAPPSTEASETRPVSPSIYSVTSSNEPLSPRSSDLRVARRDSAAVSDSTSPIRRLRSRMSSTSSSNRPPRHKSWDMVMTLVRGQPGPARTPTSPKPAPNFDHTQRMENFVPPQGLPRPLRHLPKPGEKEESGFIGGRGLAY